MQKDLEDLFQRALEASTLGKLTREITQIFQDAQLPTPELDSRLLVQHVFGVTWEELILQSDTKVCPHKRLELLGLAGERLHRKPVSRLVGKRVFWKDEFIVTDAVLDPRPDTECLLEYIINNYKMTQKTPLNILDLGVGSGCILLSLLREFPSAIGLGVDIDRQTLKTAQENAHRLKLTTRCNFLHSHWFDEVEGRFDLIVSNPPYIASDEIAFLEPEVAQFDPRKALDGGADGLQDYRLLAQSVFVHLAPEGLFVIEIGKGQDVAIKTILSAQESEGQSIKKAFKIDEITDLTGTIRALAVKTNH